ncbi:Aste57867_13156 [Aphanomyces stellatus]|uniref:Aste57867_13156 protein n=1 Tax=Aphanomyces stellatus TaxID=120398 RepID=A0A485KXF3_9STRA|nr:hypothetical protein As57867_013107 [Aphanomyces stellatus]VFT89997.1 Aste57867_13156 [Aphanomyces stellatus]
MPPDHADTDVEAGESYVRLSSSLTPPPPPLRMTSMQSIATDGFGKYRMPLPSKNVYFLYIQYAAVGVLHALLPFLAYPLFTIYLQLEGYQIASYQQLVALGWSFRVFFAMLTDCCPLLGYRRKSWLFLGWAICLTCFGFLSASSFGDPFCDRSNKYDCLVPYASLNDTSELGSFNLHAPRQGTRFIVLSMVASIGYVLVASVSDSMVVEWTGQEPAEIRGHLQTIVFAIRSVSSAAATLLGGLVLNGSRYGGSFAISMKPNLAYAVCLVVCLIAGHTTIYMIHEKKLPAVPFPAWRATLWTLLQQPLVWRVCLYRLLSSFFLHFHATPTSPMAMIYAHVEPMNLAWTSVLGDVLFGAALVGVGRVGLAWNWRACIACATLATVALDALVVLCTTWAYVRSQWFTTLVGALARVPDAVTYVMTTQCLVAAFDDDEQASLSYALAMTMSSVGQSFATAVYKYVDAFYDVSVQDLLGDSHYTRIQVTNTYAAAYGCQVVGALVCVVALFPANKAEVDKARANATDRPSTTRALVVLLTASVAFVLATASHLAAIYPETACRRFGGGNGILAPTGGCP